MAFEWLDTAVRGFLGSVELASHLSTIGSFGLAIGAAAATAPALGIVPRVGPLRALSLGFSSFLRRPSMTFSDRSSVVTVLNRKLAKLRSDRYIVCVGPRGVGALITSLAFLEVVLRVTVAWSLLQRHA